MKTGIHGSIVFAAEALHPKHSERIETMKHRQTDRIKTGVARTFFGAALKIAVAMWLPLAAFGEGEAKVAALMATGYKGTTTLENFQALVKLPGGVSGFSYADLSDSSTGSDIWFSDTSGNVIPHEIDTWNTSGDSFVWVRIPKIVPVEDGKGTIVLMHWGKMRTAAQTCVPSDTWAGYAGVWHMNASGAANEPDATGNGLDAEPVALQSGDVSIMTTEACKVGSGRVNTTATSKGNALRVPVYKDALTEETAFTLSGWFKPTASTSWSTLYSACNRNVDHNRFSVQINNFGSTTGTRTFIMVSGDGSHKTAEVNRRDYSDSESLVAGKWAHVTVAYNGTCATAWIDGETILDNVDMSWENPARTTDFGFHIGNLLRDDTPNLFCGLYDEVRMYDGAASADRVKADYDTMNEPTAFLSEYVRKGFILIIK